MLRPRKNNLNNLVRPKMLLITGSVEMEEKMMEGALEEIKKMEAKKRLFERKEKKKKVLFSGSLELEEGKMKKGQEGQAEETEIKRRSCNWRRNRSKEKKGKKKKKVGEGEGNVGNFGFSGG